MARTRKKQIKLGSMTAGGNRRRRRQTLSEALRRASARAHERTNRRLGQRDLKHVRASIAGTAYGYEDAPTGVLTRMVRW